MSAPIRFALHAVALALVFLASVGEWSGPDLAIALAAGIAAAAVLPPARSGGGPGLLRRAAAVPRLAWVEARDITRGSYHMALVVLGLRPWQHLGPVDVPIRAHLVGITETGVAVLAVLFTAVPGTMFLAFDAGGGCIWVHAIDASDPEGVRADLERLYAAQRGVAP